MDEFVKFIAENWENEQEYAGRMKTWCFYCGKYQEDRQPESHNEGCLHVKALAIVNAAEQSVEQTGEQSPENQGLVWQCVGSIRPLLTQAVGQTLNRKGVENECYKKK